MNDNMLIGGRWLEAHGGTRFATIDPATEEVITEVPRGGAEDVDAAASAAHAALEEGWRQTHPSHRGSLLMRLAALVRANLEELARLETLDVGKPIGQARGEMEAVAKVLEYNAGAADKIQGDSIPIGHDHLDFTVLEPLGVTAHITPWNAPLAMAIRSVAPALAAGCTVIVKPAEQTPLTTLRFGALVQEAGIPDGVFNVVTGYGEEAGAALVAHPLVRGITFTGSVETGKAVMMAAARGIKPVVLELGGKSPLVVFADADLDRAVETAAKGILTNCGQVCVAASRLLLEARIEQEFLARLTEVFAGVQLGAGLDDPQVGPLVSREQHERVLSYIELGQLDGGRVLVGGRRPPDRPVGFFVEPTIVAGVRNSARIAQEEIFGPVLTVVSFEDEQEALEAANATTFGLAAGVFTRDVDRALRFARDLRAGSVWVNDWFVGGVQAPVGGYHESGIGRERGLAGVHNYVQVKNVALRIGGRTVSA